MAIMTLCRSRCRASWRTRIGVSSSVSSKCGGGTSNSSTRSSGGSSSNSSNSCQLTLDEAQARLLAFANAAESEFHGTELRQLQRLVKTFKWAEAGSSAMALERISALAYLRPPAAAADAAKSAAVLAYYSSLLVAACAAARLGRFARALQICDYVHLEAAPKLPSALPLFAELSAAILSASPPAALTLPLLPVGHDYRVQPTLPAEAAATLARSQASGPGAGLDARGRPALRRPIRRLASTPSLASFRRDFLLPSEPCVLERAMDEWPCCHAVPRQGLKPARYTHASFLKPGLPTPSL